MSQKTMKAIVIYEAGGPEKLVYTEVPVPEVKPGWSLVRIVGRGVNHSDVWGAAFQNGGEPVHVRLEIRADTANLIGKIRSDVRDRVHGQLRQEEDKWIYEDEVIGLKSFKAWVMTYGSSVKVVEPASLAEEILDSSRRRLLNYEDGNRFHQDRR